MYPCNVVALGFVFRSPQSPPFYWENVLELVNSVYVDLFTSCIKIVSDHNLLPIVSRKSHVFEVEEQYAHSC